MNKKQRQQKRPVSRNTRASNKGMQGELLTPSEAWNHYADYGLGVRVLAYIWAGVRLR